MPLLTAWGLRPSFSYPVVYSASCMALLLAFLLAIDPFLAGLAGLLHVDGLVTTFSMLSLLSLALATGLGWRNEEWRSRLIFTAVSGGTAALAVLSKSPALLLVPLAGLILLLLIWQNRGDPLRERLQKSVFLGVIWIAAFLLIAIVVYPALWSTPGQVLQLAGGNANRHVAEALRPTFFLGQMAFDHGLLFYPFALAWRIGPVVTIGLVSLVIFMFRREDRSNNSLKTVIVFVLWTVLFIALITVAAKKFDRYALPVIPALTVLGVIGWGFWLRRSNRFGWLTLFSLLSAQVLYLLFISPYPLSAYNLLLGGPFTAQYVLPIGWGESISSAGIWLASETDVDRQSAVSGIAPSLAPFFPGQTVLAGDQGQLDADYVIITAGGRQSDPEGVEKLTADLDLMHVIRYGGLDQSWIYSNPDSKTVVLKLTDLPVPISFDEKVKLLGQDLRASNEEVRFTTQWERQASDGRFLVKIRLLDENGHVWSDLETALLNEVYFYPEHWLPDETPIVTYELDLPASTPPGQYSVELSLVEEATSAQLPILNEGAFSGVIYDAGDVSWEASGTTSNDEIIAFIPIEDASWLEKSLYALGYSIHPERIVAGADLTIDMFWRTDKKLPSGMQIALQVGDEEPILLPLSRFDSGDWQPGRIVQEKYRLPVPTHLSAGTTPVVIWPLLTGDQSVGQVLKLGTVEVMTTDRLFSLPPDIPLPMTVRFEPGIELRGVVPTVSAVSAGEKLPLTLYWLADSQTQQPVTAFVHLVDAGGDIVAQSDQWPGGLPSDIWIDGQVIIDEYELQIPVNIQPGEYRVAVGLYDANNGRRFSAENQAGENFADDQVLLPLVVEIAP